MHVRGISKHCGTTFARTSGFYLFRRFYFRFPAVRSIKKRTEMRPIFRRQFQSERNAIEEVTFVLVSVEEAVRNFFSSAFIALKHCNTAFIHF